MEAEVLEVGFEPTKLSQRCLRPSPLTTRESQLISTFKLEVLRTRLELVTLAL